MVRKACCHSFLPAQPNMHRGLAEGPPALGTQRVASRAASEEVQRLLTWRRSGILRQGCTASRVEPAAAKGTAAAAAARRLGSVPVIGVVPRLTPPQPLIPRTGPCSRYKGALRKRLAASVAAAPLHIPGSFGSRRMKAYTSCRQSCPGRNCTAGRQCPNLLPRIMQMDVSQCSRGVLYDGFAAYPVAALSERLRTALPDNRWLGAGDHLGRHCRDVCTRQSSRSGSPLRAPA